MSVGNGGLAALERWVDRPAAEPGARGLDWLESERVLALERARERGVPDHKAEAWRYTGLERLFAQEFTARPEAVPTVTEDDLERLLVPDLEADRVVLVNGRFSPTLSRLDHVPSGMRAGSLRQFLAEEPEELRASLNRIAGHGVHVFSDINTAAMDDGFVLVVGRNASPERPIELIHLATAGGTQAGVAQPRHLVVLEAGAEATLIERYLSSEVSAYCTNSVMEVALGADSLLSHCRVQEEGPNAFHLSSLYLRQDARSRYEGVSFGIGGAWARTDLVARFAGEGAACEIDGLYLAGDGQLMDFHLDVEHRVPGCTSRENFKGILLGKGRAVFDGRVFVAQDAQKTDAALSNKNLLLSRSAEVDTKPQLEIHADDVKCSHGTTVGQLEPEMLFYLRSRGLSEPLARRMLCLGFAEEIVDAIGQEPMRHYLSSLVGGRLEGAALE